MLGQLSRVLCFNAGLSRTSAAERALLSFTIQRWCRLLCGRLCVIQTAVDTVSSCCKLDALYKYIHCHYIG